MPANPDLIATFPEQLARALDVRFSAETELRRRGDLTPPPASGRLQPPLTGLLGLGLGLVLARQFQQQARNIRRSASRRLSATDGGQLAKGGVGAGHAPDNIDCRRWFQGGWGRDCGSRG